MTVKTTPPSMANPPDLKSQKLDQSAPPVPKEPSTHDQIRAPNMAVGIPIKQNQ
ncbi:hypothetical protein FACS1894218_2980 [Bacilli bacterium]|nr:hypothetical protein FACS1894218_2980 [Bacilli bacterium]